MPFSSDTSTMVTTQEKAALLFMQFARHIKKKKSCPSFKFEWNGPKSSKVSRTTTTEKSESLSCDFLGTAIKEVSVNLKTKYCYMDLKKNYKKISCPMSCSVHKFAISDENKKPTEVIWIASVFFVHC